ncbi:MAG: glycosyltransferase [Anaerolineales bacterium]|nr:glycosyltransferase [Anaerolineales bacterium]
MYPKITIVTPSLNQARFISRTIESVVNQNYPSLEYIVMDGGSTDDTVTILRRYSGQLTWKSEKDLGQSHAVNKGLRSACGDVVAFLNSDDIYDPGALLTIGKYFSEHPEAAWVTGRCRNIDPEGRVIRKWITCYKNFWLWVNSQRILKIINFISQPATFWRRSVMEKIGYLDENIHYAMDYDYWLRIGRLYPLHIIWKNLACFRIHPNSKAGSSANKQFDSEMEIARRHINSHMILGLHEIHRMLTVGIYTRFHHRQDR